MVQKLHSKKCYSAKVLKRKGINIYRYVGLPDLGVINKVLPKYWFHRLPHITIDQYPMTNDQ